MYNQITSNKRKTWFLIFIFTAVIMLLGWLISAVGGYGYGSLVAAGAISLAMTSVSYFQGDKIALWSAGATKPITKTDNPYYYRMAENLAITAGLPMPKLYIIPDQAINAFATGRDPQHASIAVTQGALEKLTNEELEGVLAHEYAHVKNYDIRLMTIVIVLVGIVSLLADWFWRSQFFGGRNNDNNKHAGVLMIIGLVLIIFSPIIAQLIQLAVSRKREFLADATGALLTRYPEGLANALEKIAQDHRPMRGAHTATAHLFIANPLKSKGWSRLFATHPPIEERVRALRAMTI